MVLIVNGVFPQHAFESARVLVKSLRLIEPSAAFKLRGLAPKTVELSPRWPPFGQQFVDDAPEGRVADSRERKLFRRERIELPANQSPDRLEPTRAELREAVQPKAPKQFERRTHQVRTDGEQRAKTERREPSLHAVDQA